MRLLVLQLFLQLLQNVAGQVARNGLSNSIQPATQLLPQGNFQPQGMPLQPPPGSTFQTQGTQFQGVQNSLQPNSGTQFQTVPLPNRLQPSPGNTLTVGGSTFQAAPGTSLQPFQPNSIQPLSGPTLPPGQSVASSSLQPNQNTLQSTIQQTSNIPSSTSQDTSNNSKKEELEGSVIQMNGRIYLLENNGRLLEAPNLAGLVGSTIKNGQVMNNPLNGILGPNNVLTSPMSVGPNGQLLNGTGNILFPQNGISNGMINNNGNGLTQFSSAGIGGNGLTTSNNIFPGNSFAQNNGFSGNGLVQQPNVGFGFNGNGMQARQGFVGSPVTRVNQIPMRFPVNPDPRMVRPPIPGQFNTQFGVPTNGGFPMQMNRQMPGPDPRQFMRQPFPGPPVGRGFPFPGPPQRFGPILPRGPQRFGPILQRAG